MHATKPGVCLHYWRSMRLDFTSTFKICMCANFTITMTYAFLPTALMLQVPAPTALSNTLPLEAWQIVVSHFSAAHIGTFRGLAKMMLPLYFPHLYVAMFADKYGKFFPYDLELPECLPHAVRKHLRLDTQQVSDDFVEEFLWSSNFVASAYWRDVYSLEIKGKFWTVMQILKHFQSHEGSTAMQVLVILTDTCFANCNSDVRDLLEVVSKYPRLHNLAINGVPARLGDLNVLSSNTALMNLTAGCVILRGVSLELKHVQDLCLMVNLDSEAMSCTHLITDKSLPALLNLNFAHTNSPPLIFDQLMHRTAGTVGHDPGHRHTRINNFVQHVLSFTEKLQSLGADIILNEATLAQIATHTHLRRLCIRRLRPEDGMLSDCPWARPLPVLESVRELTCSTLCLHQLRGITPNATCVKFDTIASRLRRGPLTTQAFRFRGEGPLAAQPDLDPGSVYSLPDSILSLNTQDSAIDLGYNPGAFSHIVKMYLEIQATGTHAHKVAVPPSFAPLTCLRFLTLDGSIEARPAVLRSFLESLAHAPSLNDLTLATWKICSLTPRRLGLLHDVTCLKLVDCTVTADTVQDIVLSMGGLERLHLELCHGVVKAECKEMLLHHTGAIGFRILCNDWQPLFKTNAL